MLAIGALATTACERDDPDPTARSTPSDDGDPSPHETDVGSAAAGTLAPAIASTTSMPADTGADAALPDGFDRVAARVTEPEGTVCDLCLWIADTGDQRARGLMFVTDLGPADGMAFRYPSPHTGRFWMKNTLLPLSIAFFGPDGRYLDAFDMEPCTAEPCPRYPTPPDFLVAVEVPRGGLPGVGMVPGSTLELLDLACAA